MQDSIDSAWSLSADEVARRLETDLENGLSADEAALRLERFGPNELRETAKRGPLRMFVGQFADFMIGLLFAAALISLAIGEWTDAVLIGLILLANAVIGFVQEWRAENAVAALKKLSRPEARVWRDGRAAQLPAAELVPGDLIELKAGDVVPADARLAEAADLGTNESALTGESLPIDKLPEAVASETPLPDRLSMLYAGTAVARGRGRAIVTATGMDTELGNIASLLETAEVVQTPLQRRLAAFSKRLAVAIVAVCILIFAVGILREEPANWDRTLLTRMLLTAVSLAVAAMPEGLPAVITVALALGSQKMARRKAIVRRLPAVETLGSVDVICTDKTGTLTQNEMTVADLIAVDDSEGALEELLTAAVLCNDAEVSESGELIGSATEAAILQAALDRGLDPRALREQRPRLDEIPFSSDRKRMTTLHRTDGGDQSVPETADHSDSGPSGALRDTGRRDTGGRRIYVKGAVETILDRCTGMEPDSVSPVLQSPASPAAAANLRPDSLRHWHEKAQSLAERGRRVLAIAARDWDRDRLGEGEEVENSLELLGLVGIVDPVRPEAREAIAECRSAGIRAVMITGDHQGTARAIGEELDLLRPGDEVLSGTELDGMDDALLRERAPRVAVYARVSPEHKLRIVRAYQSQGSIPAMTGDGVNDAPALKQADIGVAMGITGTDVAKEAAEMVLADDNFATIVVAVEEGRVVYDNIRKFIRYLLTTNTGEVLVLLLAVLLGMPLPLLPVHILWINLVTDGLPALALGFEPAEPNVMQRKPRPRGESIFAGGMLIGIAAIGLLMGAACAVLFHLFLGDMFNLPTVPVEDDPAGWTEKYARTMVFLTLSMFQLWYVLAIRSSSETFFRLGPWSNRRLTGAVLLGTALQLVVIYAPPLQGFFHTVPLSAPHLLLGLAVSMTAFLALESYKVARRMGAGGRIKDETG